MALTIAAGVSATCAREARADQAVVAIPYAEPPPRRWDPPPIASDDDGYEPYRSSMRLQLAAMGATTGRGVAPGLGVAADFGRGTIGVRLAAAWMRGEPSSVDPSPLADGLAQYTGEVTVDLHKRGPLHPVMAFGFGLARVMRGGDSGNLGVGTARLGLEYALAIEDADVRVVGGVTGALPGPAEREVEDVKGWAMFGGGVAIGF